MDDVRKPSQEFNGYFIEDLSVGMTAVFAKTVTEADIVLFAGISGDTNPVHLNEEYASTTMFKGRIAHGMLSAGFISALLGTKLPGPGCIYMSQNLKFKAPVRAGDTVVARGTVTDVNAAKRRVTIQTTCTVGDTVVLDGEALLMVPTRG
ncbi:3-hydroxybutyryl-CoA dehydratase [Azospirillum fermentarium]|uniref:MaoC family dehydratase n=1 Tax=Azospirillum fermentarium TaxID=1233114 RepID=UPI0022262BCC|nr:MaoC family dehydratase [Azospirillum fermentarium]MCW2246086.1 3-hydroxybutyryl-CoA dehydratase [Azospirillum fermentarium]